MKKINFFEYFLNYPVAEGRVTPHSEIIEGDEPPCIFEPPCCKKGGGSHTILKS